MFEDIGKIEGKKVEWEESKHYGLSRKIMTLSDLESKRKDGFRFRCALNDGVKLVYYFEKLEGN